MNIPLFPLGTVLFPGGHLPLQIFEVRYLDMVRRCHREGLPFGVVCLTEGQEVQKADPAHGGYVSEAFHPTGTLANITALQQPQPGLLVIQCTGSERFRVERSEKRPHGLWTAEVTVLDADQTTPVPPELQGIGEALQHLYHRLQTEQSGWAPPLPTDQPGQVPWNDAGWLANRWAELLPLPPAVKQRLLTLDSPLVRLELVGDALEQLGISH